MADFPDSDAKVVLVVDEDPLIRGRAARILAEAGYAVLTASGEEEALALAEELGDRLGLVVLGSDLPG